MNLPARPNPKGIPSSSPGLRAARYPGSAVAGFSTPTGLRHLCTGWPQPRWGCLPSAMFPKVARASQPWALRRNPVGIRQLAVILNEIDPVLAGHYGFTAEELDFLLNYDIKYRLGRSTDTEEN